MATSLLVLLDDIASILDDVAVFTKVAAQKTAGVLGDDLALNAQQVTGVQPNRELPVVWGVAKGSLLNKLILVPTALALNAFAPWALPPLLMAGGTFLCFEGFEKLAHKYLHPKAEEKPHHKELVTALADPSVDVVALEKEKIAGAVRTDFILSAEIVVITLGTVAQEPFLVQVGVLMGISLIMTTGVYGLVAGIVKLDDLGLYLNTQKDQFKQTLGKYILIFAPYLMKTLSVVGTAAMFLVGGGIIAHGIPVIHKSVEELAHSLKEIAAIGPVLEAITPTFLEGLLGMVVGAIVVAIVTFAQRTLKPAKT